MLFKQGESVKSNICPNMIGTIKKYTTDKNFILIVSGKEILCHEDYYTKINGGVRI